MLAAFFEGKHEMLPNVWRELQNAIKCLGLGGKLEMLPNVYEKTNKKPANCLEIEAKLNMCRSYFLLEICNLKQTTVKPLSYNQPVFIQTHIQHTPVRRQLCRITF